MDLNPKLILEKLQEHFPDAKSELNFNNPFELLVSTILSAQCTDDRVNKVTPKLFAKFPTPQEMANADINEVIKIIFSTGFYNQKAKKILETAKIIDKDFDGKVPDRMKDLQKLPGVARKTANVVLYNAFGKNEGIAVDTHVIRMAKVLGLSTERSPEKIEQDLMKYFPKEQWGFLSQSLVLYGRYFCKAKKHDHNKCFLGGEALK